MFSTEGGMDIESVPADKIALHERRRHPRFQDLRCPQPRQQGQSAQRTYRPGGKADCRLYDTFKIYGARLIEINPMVVTKDGKVLASDWPDLHRRLFVIRHPELGIHVARESGTPPTELDKIAWWVEEKDLRGTCYFAEMNNAAQRGGLRDDSVFMAWAAAVRCWASMASTSRVTGAQLCRHERKSARLQGLPCVKAGLFTEGDRRLFMLGRLHGGQTRSSGIMPMARQGPAGGLPKRPGFPVLLLLAGNKEKESLEILREGRRISMPGSGSTAAIACTDTVGLAAEMKEMVLEYKKERKG